MWRKKTNGMKEMEKVCDRIHYYEEFQKSWREVVVF